VLAAHPGEDGGVEAVIQEAAGKDYVLLVAEQLVPSGSADQRVVAEGAEEPVVAGAARQPVVAAHAVDHIVAGAGIDHVVGEAGGEAVIAGAGREEQPLRRRVEAPGDTVRGLRRLGAIQIDRRRDIAARRRRRDGRVLGVGHHREGHHVERRRQPPRSVEGVLQAERVADLMQRRPEGAGAGGVPAAVDRGVEDDLRAQHRVGHERKMIAEAGQPDDVDRGGSVEAGPGDLDEADAADRGPGVKGGADRRALRQRDLGKALGDVFGGDRREAVGDDFRHQRRAGHSEPPGFPGLQRVDAERHDRFVGVRHRLPLPGRQHR
jgi:hypothetical protein